MPSWAWDVFPDLGETAEAFTGSTIGGFVAEPHPLAGAPSVVEAGGSSHLCPQTDPTDGEEREGFPTPA